MKIKYDAQADPLYIPLWSLAPGTAQCQNLADEIMADFGPDGRLAGIEIVEVSALLGEERECLMVEMDPPILAKTA